MNDEILSNEGYPLEIKKYSTTLKKALIFCILMFLNRFSGYLFIFIAVAFGAQYLNGDALYAVNWVVNDLSAYLFLAIGGTLIFRGEHGAADYAPYTRKKALPILAAVPVMFALGSIASYISTYIAAILDTIFGTGEIPDALAEVAPQNENNFWIFFVFVCITGPILEEIIFRYILLRPLRKGGDGFAVLLSALIFGIYHGNFDQFPYTFAVGACLAAVAVLTNSLLPTIILHIFNNVFVTLGNYLPSAFEGNETALAISNALNVIYSVLIYIGLAALIAIIVFKAQGKKFKSNYSFLSVSDKLKLAFGHWEVYVMGVALALMFVNF